MELESAIAFSPRSDPPPPRPGVHATCFTRFEKKIKKKERTYFRSFRSPFFILYAQ